MKTCVIGCAMLLLLQCKAPMQEPEVRRALGADAVPAGAEADATAVLAEPLGDFTDLGALRGKRAVGWSEPYLPAGVFAGGDPWMGQELETGRWWVFYTLGPNPEVGAQIYRRSADTPLGPWSDAQVALTSTPKEAGLQALRDTHGVETITACRVSGRWFWLYMAHDKLNRDWIYAAESHSLNGPLRKLGPVSGPTLRWEMDIFNSATRVIDSMYGEPSVISRPFGLLSLYSVRSPSPNGERVKSSIMHSPPGHHGVTWLKRPQPVWNPPGRFGQRGVVVSINHGGWTFIDGVYRAFHIRGGKFPYGPGQRGVHHTWSTDLQTWHLDPDNPVIPTGVEGSDTYGHVGGPHPFMWEGRLHVVYHAQAHPLEEVEAATGKPYGSKGRHLRLAVVQ